jgi:hypothetical protein
LVEAKVDESRLELERRQKDMDWKIRIINSYPEGKRRLEIKRLNLSILNGEEYFLPELRKDGKEGRSKNTKRTKKVKVNLNDDQIE